MKMVIVEGIMAPYDAQRIIKILITSHKREDHIIWHYSNNGAYSVKLRYFLD